MAKLFILLLFLPGCLFAEDRPIDPNKIEVNYTADRLLPYKQRRADFSWIFGFNIEQLYFPKFRSRIDGYSFEELYGKSTLDIIQGQVGAKYNTAIGSIGGGLIYGQGFVSDGRIAHTISMDTGQKVDTDSTLEIEKYAVYAHFVLDTIFGEPYVAPYLEAQLFQFRWVETAKNTSISPGGTTQPALAFIVGALFQLNWLDPNSALEAQNNIGLNNTFLDLFVSFYSGPGGDDDPGLASSDNYGAGIKLEF